MHDIPGEGVHLGRDDSLWLRGIPGDGFSCEPSASITPGSCGDAGLSLKGWNLGDTPQNLLQRIYKNL